MKALILTLVLLSGSAMTAGAVLSTIVVFDTPQDSPADAKDLAKRTALDDSISERRQELHLIRLGSEYGVYHIPELLNVHRGIRAN